LNLTKQAKDYLLKLSQGDAHHLFLEKKLKLENRELSRGLNIIIFFYFSIS